jgi:hypothetical protein
VCNVNLLVADHGRPAAGLGLERSPASGGAEVADARFADPREGNFQDASSQDASSQDARTQDGSVQEAKSQVVKSQDGSVQDAGARERTSQNAKAQDGKAQDGGGQEGNAGEGTSQDAKSQDAKPLDDAQLFYNPKYDDSALPVRREEEWTPPPPIDWTVEGPLELNFDHLKFNIQPDQAFEVRQLTLDLLKLRGRTIKIRGYVRPSFKEKNITRFVFVRDNQECCFGPGALLYDCMIVNMAEGHAVNFSTRPITLEGRFALKPFRGPDKRVWAIFELNETVLR